MKVNSIYSEVEIKKSGLKLGLESKTENKIYIRKDKVYFFEELKKDALRLHSIINEKSYYL